MPKNSSKAFQYFLMAASFETDADSIFNAGHCLEHGLGTEVDLSRAVEFYSIAANKLGNFDSIQALGNMYLEVVLFFNCSSSSIAKQEMIHDSSLSKCFFVFFCYCDDARVGESPGLLSRRGFTSTPRRTLAPGLAGCGEDWIDTYTTSSHSH